MAGRRHRCDSSERPLNDVQQPVARQGPLRIVEPPLSTGERMSVNDPLRTIANDWSGRTGIRASPRQRAPVNIPVLLSAPLRRRSWIPETTLAI